jgi:predicted ATPase with chaperone activity
MQQQDYGRARGPALCGLPSPPTTRPAGLPPKRITVNLAPADLAKEGSHFDLPIAPACSSP